MPDNSTTPPNGLPVASDDIGGFQFQRNKLIHGADGVNAGDVSTANPLPVSALGEGLISTANSTAVVLAANAVFTGTAEDVTEYCDARLYVFSDQASAVDGLQIQQSSNGTNWDAADVYSIPAATGKVFGIGIAARFFRVVFTNGAVLQTAFRLQVKYHKSYSKGSSTRPQDARGNDNDFEETAAYLFGYNGTAWDRLRSTIANGLAVDVTRLPALVAGTAVIGKVDQRVCDASADVTLQTAAVAVGNGVLLTTTGYGTALIQVTGTFVGTITFEGTQDTTNFVSVAATQMGVGSIASVATAPGIYRLSVSGLTSVRARISAYTSGSITATGRTTNAPFSAKFIQVAAGANSIGTVQMAAITKGTQGTTGVTTQDLKDAGRVMFSVATAIAGVTAVATEALVTMVPQRDGTAGTTATSHPVTATKRLRITSITVGLISSAAAVLSGRISLRIGAAAAATATSPIVVTVPIPSGAALIQAGGSLTQSFPDGIEFSGAQQLGVSQVCSAATGTIWVSLTGYEY